jgi:hypothetical protein
MEIAVGGLYRMCRRRRAEVCDGVLTWVELSPGDLILVLTVEGRPIDRPAVAALWGSRVVAFWVCAEDIELVEEG